ncbi:MAG: neutral/alkaline non-lysosomal ceramidase N-terminal domain-containing protein [Promethearchaeota archaeon]
MAGSIEIAVAREDITPHEPVYLMGYASRNQKSRGIHSRIYLQALMIRPQDTKGCLFVITYDLGWFGVGEAALLRETIARECNLRGDDVFLSCSHTHYAPSVNKGHWIDENPGYLEFIINKSVAAINRCKNSVPVQASLWYGVGKTSIGINRRKFDEKRKRVDMKPNMDGPRDDRIQVIGFKDDAGRWVAVLFKVSCHPVGTPSGDYLIHGSWPREAMNLLESGHGDRTRFMFLNGTAGDVRPRNLARDGTFKEGSIDVEMMEEATEVAGEVGDILKTAMKKIERVNIRMVLKRVPVRLEPVFKRKDVVKLSKKRKPSFKRSWAREIVKKYISRNIPIPTTVDISVHVIHVNPEFHVIGLGGEACTGLGKAIDSSVGGETIIVGYVNDTRAYLPSSRIVQEDVVNGYLGYEGYFNIFLFDLPNPFSVSIDADLRDGIADIINSCRE